MKVISPRYIFLLDFWLVGYREAKKINGSRNSARGVAVKNWQELSGKSFNFCTILLFKSNSRNVEGISGLC